MNPVSRHAKVMIRKLMELQEAATRLPADPVLANLLTRSILRVSNHGGLWTDDIDGPSRTG